MKYKFSSLWKNKFTDVGLNPSGVIMHGMFYCKGKYSWSMSPNSLNIHGYCGNHQIHVSPP